MEEKQTEPSNHESMMYEVELNNLADVIADIKNANTETPLATDPFDEYRETMSCKIFADPNDFRIRFIRGYNALIRQIRKELSC